MMEYSVKGMFCRKHRRGAAPVFRQNRKFVVPLQYTLLALFFPATRILLAAMTIALAFVGLMYGIYSLSCLTFGTGMRKCIEKGNADSQKKSPGKGFRAFLFRAVRPLYWLPQFCLQAKGGRRLWSGSVGWPPYF